MAYMPRAMRKGIILSIMADSYDPSFQQMAIFIFGGPKVTHGTSQKWHLQHEFLYEKSSIA